MDRELRKTPRKKPQKLIYVEFGPDNGGMMRDLSENGLGFRSVGPLPHGTKIPFSFSLGPGQFLQGEVELIWTDPEGRVGGLRFVNAESVQNQIRLWLEREQQRLASAEEGARSAPPQTTFEELRKELRGETSSAIATIAPIETERLGQKNVKEPEAPQPVGVSQEMKAISKRVNEPKTSVPAPSAEKFALPRQLIPVQKEINLGLEPLAPFQGTLGETKRIENVSLGWVIFAMLFLTLVAACVVYQHELGQALTWVGAKFAGAYNSDAVAPEQTPVQQSAPPADSATENSSDIASHSANSASTPPENLSDSPKHQTAGPGSVDKRAQSGLPEPSSPKARQAVPANNQENGSAPDKGTVGNSSILKNPDSGQAELQRAQEILNGEGAIGNVSEAVQLLWVAVERGNSDAEVALADLYRNGEGVTQNCDQMRVLLNAAARKGNSQAKARLVDIARTGCP